MRPSIVTPWSSSIRDIVAPRHCTVDHLVDPLLNPGLVPIRVDVNDAVLVEEDPMPGVTDPRQARTNLVRPAVTDIDCRCLPRLVSLDQPVQLNNTFISHHRPPAIPTRTAFSGSASHALRR